MPIQKKSLTKSAKPATSTKSVNATGPVASGKTITAMARLSAKPLSVTSAKALNVTSAKALNVTSAKSLSAVSAKSIL